LKNDITRHEFNGHDMCISIAEIAATIVW